MRPRAKHRPQAGRRRPSPAAPPAEPVPLAITRLGAQGDGIARLPDGAPVFLPDALPGERITARLTARRGDGWTAEQLTREADSPERAPPPCPQFGVCGGCTVQHLADTAYAAWKRGLLMETLARAGFADAPVAALQRTPAGRRRRADLAIARAGDDVRIGFNRRGARSVAHIAGCLVLDPCILALTDPLRMALAGTPWPQRAGSAVVNLTDTGADLLLEAEAAPDAGARERLIAFARGAGLARLSWRPARARGADAPEPIIQFRAPRMRFGDVVVPVPPGAFLQASPEGEAAILAAVLAALEPLGKRGGKARIADLFAGLGTLSFPLARLGRVLAMEGDGPAIEALGAAARKADMAGRISAERRDLAARPLAGNELAGLDAVVLDPPFAGAEAQCRALAGSRVPLIVYVSCNPAALARDARLLAGGGYHLAGATPIDQFLWSGHLETVAVFQR
ncbi:MAG: class I SAM-dependent RNA methyltransferase [Alphaproteobacteria bacterium]|nr:class I SAM-dependent RNA methyltransferase [Alphaproteobacteria bacterium]